MIELSTSGTQEIKHLSIQGFIFESIVRNGTQEIKLFSNQGLKFESLVRPGTQEIQHSWN